MEEQRRREGSIYSKQIGHKALYYLPIQLEEQLVPVCGGKVYRGGIITIYALTPL